MDWFIIPSIKTHIIVFTLNFILLLTSWYFFVFRQANKTRQAEHAEAQSRALAEALQGAAKALNSTLDVEFVLTQILRSVEAVTTYDLIDITFIEGREIRTVRRRGKRDTWDGETFKSRPLNKFPILEQIVISGEPVIVPDVSIYSGWVTLPKLEWIRSYMNIPISHNGRVIGFIGISSELPGFFSETLAEQLQVFADQAAIALENARRYAQSERRNQRLSILNEITRIGTSTIDRSLLITALCNTVPQIIKADDCYITLWDKEKQRLVPGDTSSDFRKAFIEMDISSQKLTPGSHVVLTREPLTIPDIQDTPYFSRDMVARFPVRSLLALPLQIADQPVGAMMLSFTKTHRFTENEIIWASQAADLVALTIAQADTYAELQARNRDLDSFTATVAHDLKQPLSLITSYSNLLRTGFTGKIDEEAMEFISLIEEHSYKMSDLIKDLMLFSQLPTAHEVNEDFSAAPLIESAISRYEDKIATRKVVILIEKGLPKARGYKPWVEEVFANLIGNAIKYIGAENPTPHIEICGLSQADGMVRYEVKDNGLGISPDDQSQLFESFTRFHHDHAEGYGLGLSIVARIVKKLDGEVGVESNVGKGSVFWFTLPPIETTGKRVAFTIPAKDEDVEEPKIGMEKERAD